MKSEAVLLVALAFIVLAMFVCSKEQAPARAQKATGPTEQELAGIATEAYIYGYPLVTMEMTRRVMTITPPQGVPAM